MKHLKIWFVGFSVIATMLAALAIIFAPIMIALEYKSDVFAVGYGIFIFFGVLSYFFGLTLYEEKNDTSA